MRLCLILVSVTFFSNGYTQSIRGGEILVKHKAEKHLEIELNLYSETMAWGEIVLFWGDGSSDTLDAYSSLIDDDIFISTYHAVHDYTLLGLYGIGLKETFLIGDIVNIPDASSKSFNLTDSILITSDVDLSVDTSPEFLSYQTQVEFDSGIYYHSVDLYELEGDSVNYEIIPFPAEGSYLPTFTDSLSISNYGQLVWDRPQQPGIYALAIRVHEFRNGIQICTTTRTMIIKVDSVLISEISTMNLPKLSVYPNPCNSNISIEGYQYKNAEILTTNYIGQEVSLYWNSEYEADVTNLVDGIYITTIISNLKTRSVIWVKQ